jgi:hypothetical protein
MEDILLMPQFWTGITIGLCVGIILIGCLIYS